MNTKLVGWLIWLAIYLPVMFLLVSLGFWQLQRADQKTALQSQLAAVSVNEIISSTEIPHMADLLEVRLQGNFLANHHWLLDNQIDERRFGYRVFTPFCDVKGCVLVDRGWVAGDLDRSKLPGIEAPSSIVKIQGRISQFQENPLLKENDATESWPRRVQELDFMSIEREMGLMTRHEKKLFVKDRILHLNPGEPGAYKPIWKPVVMGPDKHMGYAVQWFTMAIGFTVLMVWFGLSRKKSDE